MIKKFFNFLLICICYQFVMAQTFDYERAWGTYYGPAGTSLASNFVFDSQNNFNFSGYVKIDSNLGASYYNQFVTSGEQPVNLSYFNDNTIQSQFDEDGVLISSGYRGGSAGSGTTLNFNYNNILVHIDSSGSRYFIQYSSNTISDSGTSNAWFVNDPITSSGQPHTILYKRDSLGNMIYKTYLPLDSSEFHLQAIMFVWHILWFIQFLMK